MVSYFRNNKTKKPPFDLLTLSLFYSPAHLVMAAVTYIPTDLLKLTSYISHSLLWMFPTPSCLSCSLLYSLDRGFVVFFFGILLSLAPPFPRSHNKTVKVCKNSNSSPSCARTPQQTTRSIKGHTATRSGPFDPHIQTFSSPSLFSSFFCLQLHV